MPKSYRFSALIFSLLMLPGAAAFGQSQGNPPADDSSKSKKAQGTDEADPLKRELTPEQKKKNEKAFKREVSDTYKKWIDNDVSLIITDEERQAFKQLSNDDERDNFIEQFWLRRDPTPDTVENEFKEEHYQRIAYANEHFAAGKPGWKTDRGQMYVKFGPPDQIDSHPSGGTYQRPMSEGGGETSTFPFETWRYRYLEGPNLGNEVEIEFVDTCMCGDYHMTMDRSEKDALLHVPGAGQTLYESMGLADKSERFTGGGLENIGKGPYSGGNTDPKMFDRLAQFHALSKPPSIKFKDLDEVVSHHIRYNVMPFDFQVDYVKVTEDTVLVPITIQVNNSDITFEEKDGVARGVVNIFGRVTTLTGRIAQTFEDTVSVEVPAELRDKTAKNKSIYWKALPLRSGRYKIDLVVKDVKGNEGRLGTISRGLEVPNMGEDRGLMTSTLILADRMERVETSRVGGGNFVIGDTLVRPRVKSSKDQAAVFKKKDSVNVWMQVYNLAVDETTKKSQGTVEYEIVNTTTNKSVVSAKDDAATLAKGGQMTVEKTLSLASLEPGTYQITIKVNDLVAKQSLPPQSAKFVVEQ